MLTVVAVFVVALAYFAGMSLSYGFFWGAIGDQAPDLPSKLAIIWPVSLVLYGLYVLHTFLTRRGYSAGAIANDRVDLL